MRSVQTSSLIAAQISQISGFGGDVQPWATQAGNLQVVPLLGTGSSGISQFSGTTANPTVAAHHGAFNLVTSSTGTFNLVASSTNAIGLQTQSTIAISVTPSGTVPRPWTPVGAPVQPMYWSSPNITIEGAAAEQIFDSIQSLYLSNNKQRDRLIADRITALYRDALQEDERIYLPSLRQFTQFFITNKDLGFPRITLTPDETLRVRWITAADKFVAIEFTGECDAKLVVEIPGLAPPMRFSREPVANVLAVARAMGGSFP
jgi:hypothetical protein